MTSASEEAERRWPRPRMLDGRDWANDIGATLRYAFEAGAEWQATQQSETRITDERVQRAARGILDAAGIEPDPDGGYWMNTWDYAIRDARAALVAALDAGPANSQDLSH